jgi:prepilin peptidase CpaA
MIPPDVVASAFTLALMTLLAFASIEDARNRIIPNRIPLLVFAVCVLGILAIPDMQQHYGMRLASFASMVLAGTLLGMLGIFGGGDIKLLAAIAPWHPVFELPALLFAIGIAGGVMGLFFVLRAAAGQEGWKAGLKQPVPYAVAIFAGEGAMQIGLMD